MVGGASYRDGVVYLSKSQIINTETGKKSSFLRKYFDFFMKILDKNFQLKLFDLNSIPFKVICTMVSQAQSNSFLNLVLHQ